MERRTGRLAVTAALLVAGGLVWSWRRPAPEVEGEGEWTRCGPSAADGAPSPADVAWLESAGGSGLRAKDPTSTPQEPGHVGEIPLAPADGAVRLVLQLVGDGLRPREIGVVAHAEGPGFPVRLRLAGGTLEGRLPMAATYEQLLVTLDGWETEERFLRVAVPDTGIVTLDVTLPGRASLVVVDAATEVPLAGAHALACEGLLDTMDDAVAPQRNAGRRGPRSPIFGDAAGRILLPRGSAALDWWVGAPDHAWVRRRVAAGASDVRVALEPGGGILAEIEDWEEVRERNPRIVATRRRPLGDRGDAEPHVPGDARDSYEQTRDVDLTPTDVAGAFLLEGVPPGPYKVVVGSAAQVFLGEVWGEAAVEVQAGRLTRVRVAACPPRDLGRVALDLEVSVPSEWGEGTCLGVLRRRGGPEGDAPRLLSLGTDVASSRHRIEGLVPGAYQLTVTSGWSCVLHVDGRNPLVRVAVPPPASLRVRVLEADGDASVGGATVLVRYPAPRETDSGRQEDASPTMGESDMRGWSQGWTALERSPGSDEFVGRVASGVVWVDATATGRVSTSVCTTLAPGGDEAVVEMRLPLAGRVSVRVLHGTTTAKDATGSIVCAPQREVGDAGRSERTRVLQQGTALFERVPPGPYRVSWSSGRGEPAATREIAVRAGETVTVDFSAK